MKKYVIINTNVVSSIDFSKVLETSANTLRYSLDNTKTFVKFKGSTPSFLSGKTQYDHGEIIQILQGSDWSEDED